jgi:hypothetical protein
MTQLCHSNDQYSGGKPQKVLDGGHRNTIYLSTNQAVIPINFSILCLSFLHDSIQLSVPCFVPQDDRNGSCLYFLKVPLPSKLQCIPWQSLSFEVTIICSCIPLTMDLQGPPSTSNFQLLWQCHSQLHASFSTSKIALLPLRRVASHFHLMEKSPLAI